MANEDFYLTFGSNASTWARTLKNDLRPAYEEIRILNAAIAGLQRNIQGVSGPLATALTKSLPPSVAGAPTGAGTGGGGGGAKIATTLERAATASNAMVEDLYLASDELKNLLGGLSTAVQGLRELPTLAEGTFKGIQNSLGDLVRSTNHTLENIANRHPLVDPSSGRYAQGGVPQGGLFQTFLTDTRRLLNGGTFPGGSLLNVPPAVAAPSIASVSQHAIDQGGVDRIINAIKEQTKELTAGRKPRSGVQTAVQNGEAGAEALPETARTLTQARAQLEEVDKQLAAAVAGLGTSTDQADRAVIDKMRKFRTDLAAEVAKLERSEEGVTRPQQQQARRTSFAQDQAQLEEVTKEEKKARLDRLALIKQAQSPDLLSQVGRGNGLYGLKDLRSMAEALGVAGFPIKGVTRKRLPELAALVSQNAQAYGEQYPVGSYPEALNPRVKVASAPAVSAELREFLGSMNEFVAGIRAQRVSARTGGDIERGPGNPTPLPWTINTPPSTAKGRLGFGGGIIDVPSLDSFGSVGLEGRASRPSSAPTSEQIQNLREVLKEPFKALGGLVQGRAHDPAFNPYNEEFQTHGKSEEAAAARLYLGSLKRATDHLDSLAQAYEDDYKAVNENRDFIDRATQRIKEGAAKPDDQEKIAAAKTQLGVLQKRLAATPEDQLDLFNSSDYQLGRVRRDASRASIRTRTAEENLDPYQLDPVSRYALAESTRSALVGRRYALNVSGQASTDFTSRIPGAQNIGPNIQEGGKRSIPSITHEEGLSRADQEAIDKAISRYVSSIRKLAKMLDSAGNVTDGYTKEDVEKGAAREENSAIGVVKQLDRLFPGHQVSAEGILGRPLENPKNAKYSDTSIAADRQSAREAAVAKEQAAKATDTETTATKKKTSAAKEATAAVNTQVAALKKERSELQAGIHTRDDAKILAKGASDLESNLAGRQGGALRGAVTRATNRGDEEAANAARTRLAAAEAEAREARELATAARAAVDRLKAIKAELNELGAGRGSGSGGRGGGAGRTAAGGAGDGGEDSILRQILAELKRITSALKGTIRVTGKNITSEKETGTAAGATGTASAATGGSRSKSQTQERAAALAAIAREREAQAGIERGYQRIELAEQREIRIKQQRAEAASRADLEEARRLQGIALAMARLSAGTQAEIQKLKELHAAGASAEEIVGQQQRVFGSVSHDLSEQGVNAAGRDAAAKAVLNDAGPKLDSGQLSEIKRQAELVGRTSADTASSAASRIFGPGGFWGRILNTTGTFVVRNFAAGAVFGLTNELQQITEQAIQTEATFVRVSSALESTGKDIGTLRSDLGNISTDYGIQLHDVYETAASLTGLFDNSQDLASGARIVAQLQAISEGALNANEAVGVLASTMSAFQRQPGDNGPASQFLGSGTEGLQQIADVFTTIQNNLGVNIEDTAEGVARISGQAKQMKLSFQEASVFVAQISKQTNQTGAGAGEQLSRILASFQTGRARTALVNNLGTGILKSLNDGQYGSVIEQLIKKWDTLSDSQKANLATTIAGQRQSASFYALMNGGQATLELLSKATNSQGAAQQRMAAIMQTLNKRLDIFRTELQNVASNLVRSGILNFLGVMLVVTNKVLDIMNKLLEAFNNLADHNGFLDFLRKSITLVLGAVATFKLLGASITGLRGAISARSAGAAEETLGGSLISGPRGGGLGASVGLAAEQRAAQQAGSLRFRDYGVAYAAGRGAPIAEGRANSQLLRGLGAGVDKTLGVSLTGISNAYSKATGSAAAKMAESSNKFVRAIGVALVADAAALEQVAAGTRVGLRGAGSGQFGPAAGLRGFSNRLAASAESQSGYASELSGLGLNKQAAAAERAAGAMGKASTVTGKLASGIERMAASGALADGALVGVAIAMSSLVNYMNNSKKAAEAFGNALQSIDPANAHESADETARKKYVGPSQQAYDDIYANQLKAAQAPGFAGAQGKFGLGIQGIGGILAQGPGSYFNAITNPLGGGGKSFIQGGLARAFGTSGDLSQTYGIDQANSIVTPVLSRIKELGKGNSVNAITDVQKEANAQLDQMLKDVANNGSLSQQQKIAAAGAIDQARALIQQQGDNAISTAEGLHKSQVLLDDQIQKLQGALQILQTTGGRQTVGGLNLNQFYSDTEDDIGATGKLKNQLDKLFYGNLNAVDQQIQVRKVTKTEIRNLQARLASAQTNTNVNQEDIDNIKSELNSAIGSLSGTGAAIQQALQQNASTAAQLQAAQGNFGGAMRTYSGALQRMHHQFLVDQGLIGAAANNINIAYRQIAGDAANIDRDIDLASRAGEFAGYAASTSKKALTGAQREASRAQRAAEVAFFKQAAEQAIAKNLAALDREIAQAVDPAVQAALQAKRAQLNSYYTDRLNSGQGIPGVSKKDAQNYGDAAFTWQEVDSAQNDAYTAANSAAQSEKQAANSARQNAASIREARLGVAAAWANARGDAVAAARVGVQVAAAQIAAARADLAAASTADEKAQATVSLYTAQAAMIAANAQVAQSQADLISSRFDVSIALAEAAGHTVQAVRERLAQARAALGAALRKSGGKNTAEVNQARSAAIQAEAALRDAKLQDELDTIDFNLQMGRITQASAINALQHILQTEELTKAQRRQLLLQIKGMKDELANSQWNFGDIKLPTPYQMRRYIEQRRQQFRNDMDAAAGQGSIQDHHEPLPGHHSVSTQTTTINIDGADIGMIKKVLREVVGGSVNVRTTAPRRGNR